MATNAKEVHHPCDLLSAWQDTLLCAGLSHVIYANAVISFSFSFYYAASKLKRRSAFLFSYLDFEEQNKLQWPVAYVNAPFLIRNALYLLPLCIRTF